MYNTHSENISSFMRWASRRIAEEVAANEELEAKGVKDDIVIRHSKLPYDLTWDQKRDYIDIVDEFKDAGMSTKVACAKVDMHVSTYSMWRKKLGMGKYKPKANK